MRILIVDDEQMIGRVLRRGLPEHELDVAETAAEGLALHVVKPYPLALVDLQLPDGSGSDLVPMLQRAAPLRVVLMGGGDLEPHRRAGAEVLEKPFSVEQLRACILRLP